MALEGEGEEQQLGIGEEGDFDLDQLDQLAQLEVRAPGINVRLCRVNVERGTNLLQNCVKKARNSGKYIGIYSMCNGACFYPQSYTKNVLH